VRKIQILLNGSGKFLSLRFNFWLIWSLLYVFRILSMSFWKLLFFRLLWKTVSLLWSCLFILWTLSWLVL